LNCPVVRSFGARVALLASLLPSSTGCGERSNYEVSVVQGGNTTRFAVRTAFAEYVELPESHNELDLTIAGYATSCEHWTPPKDGEASVTVVIVTPPGTRPVPGSYAWAGLPKPDEPIRAAYALPKAQLGAQSRLFEPGGQVRLSQVELDPHGAVRGTLAFEYPGDAEHPATRVDGGFEAKVCRLTLATH
jgi:hypothetical protein